MRNRPAVGLALAASVGMLAVAPCPSHGEDATSGELVVAVADDPVVSASGASPDPTAEPWPWRVHFNLYGWLPQAPATISVDGAEGSIPENFSKILSDLEFAAMGDIEVYKGPIGVFLSPIYYKGRDSEHFEGLFERRKITLEESVWVLDYGATYAFGPWPLWSGAEATTTLEPFVGARFLNDHIRLKINAGVLEPAQTLVRKTIQFNAPIVGARARTNLTERWGLFLNGDYGGWDVDHLKETWNFGGALEYKFKIGSLQTKLFGGYRYLNVRYKDRDLKLRVAIKGVLFGFGFEL
jgi:hypothetical protein